MAANALAAKPLLLAMTALLLVTECRGEEMTDPAIRRAEAAGRNRMVIVDADAYGAVIIDGRVPVALGVRRDGRLVWRTTVDRQAPLPVACMGRCPDAVLSASGASANDATVPDPDPVLMVGSEARVVRGFAGPRRYLLSAIDPDHFVIATGGAAGPWWLELHDSGRVERIPVGGRRTLWRQSADGRHALAITAVEGGGPGSNEARWFVRNGTRWQLTNPTSRAAAGFTACLRPDGQTALLIGAAPATLDRDGVHRPVTDLPRSGTCAWSGEGGIVAALARDGGGYRADLRAFDGKGDVSWRAAVRGEVTVTADPTAPRAAYTVSGVLHEIDPRTGKELRAIEGVGAARYAEDGSLVVARSGGFVEWLPAHRGQAPGQ